MRVLRNKKGITHAAKQRGFMLVESMIAVAIVGSGILAAVVSLSTSAIATDTAREQATAAWLITSQVELIKHEPFVSTPSTYPTVTPPNDYTIANTTLAIAGGDGFIQDVVIDVYRSGELVKSVTMVKVNK